MENVCLALVCPHVLHFQVVAFAASLCLSMEHACIITNIYKYKAMHSINGMKEMSITSNIPRHLLLSL